MISGGQSRLAAAGPGIGNLCKSADQPTRPIVHLASMEDVHIACSTIQSHKEEPSHCQVALTMKLDHA
uniref:Uncharacterized protein n=1 Tax=Oryza punctata TaxID=4537 RepID=A0A0E0JKX0_ORYPU